MKMAEQYIEQLYIMDRHTQTIAGQTIVNWSEGASITAKLQISNMQSTLVAVAQGVVQTGYLVIGKQYEKYITMNTYLKHPKSGRYIRVADDGVIEAGEGAPFQEKQYSVESVVALPR